MEIKEKAISGVKWNTVSTIYAMAMQLVRLAVLTHLLEKSDFGLIAIATMIISFTDIFSDIGITVSIIHKQNITQKELSSLYWLNISISIVLYILVLTSLPLLSEFYKEPLLSNIVSLLGLQILFCAFGKIFQTIKTKQMEFNFLSKIRILSVTIGFIATISLAYCGFRVYSLVFGQLIQVLTNQVSYIIAGRHDQKILFHFDYSEITDSVKIGGYQLGARILDFISNKIDVFLIGRLFGMEDLGIYNLAKELILKPYQVILSLVNNVSSAAFARLQDDIIKLQTSYKKLISFTAILSMPIYFCMFVFSDLIVSLIYAPEFASVSVFVKILSVVGMITSIDGLAGTLQIAMGRTDIGIKWTMVRVVLSVLTILFAGYISIEAVAVGQSIVTFVCFFLYWRFAIYALIKLSFKEYARAISTPTIISFIISIPFAIVLGVANVSNIIQFVMVGFWVLAYCLYFILFKKEFSRSLIKMLIH